MMATATQGDTTVKKICSKHSPKGGMGQKYLASGIHLSMRLWEDEPAGDALSHLAFP